jgi:hypothetical protein
MRTEDPGGTHDEILFKMVLHSLLTCELRRAVDVVRRGEGIRLVGLVPRAGENVVRADVEELCIALACEPCEDLCARCVDLAAERGLVLCLVHGGVRSRVEDGVGCDSLEDGSHDVLVGQRKDLRGDTVYLMAACLALRNAIITQLSRCTCDENFHRNPPFFYFVYCTIKDAACVLHRGRLLFRKH